MKDYESNDIESAQVISEVAEEVTEEWTPDAMEISFDESFEDERKWLRQQW